MTSYVLSSRAPAFSVHHECLASQSALFASVEGRDPRRGTIVVPVSARAIPDSSWLRDRPLCYAAKIRPCSTVRHHPAPNLSKLLGLVQG